MSLLLLCRIDGRLAAFPATQVQSVIEIEEVTPIPRTQDHIVGLTGMRSQALTVIDCNRALGLVSEADYPERKAVVVQIGGHLYALLVDEAHDVAEPMSELLPLAGGFGPGWQSAATGMVETAIGPAVILDLGALVAVKSEAGA